MPGTPKDNRGKWNLDERFLVYKVLHDANSAFIFNLS